MSHRASAAPRDRRPPGSDQSIDARHGPGGLRSHSRGASCYVFWPWNLDCLSVFRVRWCLKIASRFEAGLVSMTRGFFIQPHEERNSASGEISFSGLMIASTKEDCRWQQSCFLGGTTLRAVPNSTPYPTGLASLRTVAADNLSQSSGFLIFCLQLHVLN